MKFIIDLKTCANHGQCASLAPGVFTLDDNSELAFRGQASGPEYVSDEVDPADAEMVEEAAYMCPVQAIRIE